MFSNIKYLSFLLGALLLSCGEEANSDSAPLDDSPVKKNFLISATPVQELSLQMLQGFANLAGQDEFSPLVRYGVQTVKLVYQTTYKGEPIEASGLLYIPHNLQEKASLISLQHGTTFVKSDVPSVSGSFSGMEFFASAGYIAFMPDFIGYGESAEVFHPYYDQKHSADCVIDMIKSVKEYLLKEAIPFNEKLFLAGYSEGGYVTLATAKALELDPSHGISVTAVAAGAGGYDLNEMLNGVTTHSHYSYPGYLAFVVMSYNNTYDWNLPLNYFFADGYADALNQYMTGSYGGGFINSKLTTDVNRLFNPDFFQRLKEQDGELRFKQVIDENSINGWNTKLPIRLYHGTKDEIIPYQNSESTLKGFQKAGSKDVTLTLLPGGTHGSSFVPMLKLFVPWFEQMR